MSIVAEHWRRVVCTIYMQTLDNAIPNRNHRERNQKAVAIYNTTNPEDPNAAIVLIPPSPYNAPES